MRARRTRFRSECERADLAPCASAAIPCAFPALQNPARTRNGGGRPRPAREPRFRRRADSAGGRLHHRRRRQAAAPRARAAVGARLRIRRPAPVHARGGRRDDSHGDAAARRRRRRVEAAARPRDRQRDVRQRRIGAGRRLSLFPRVPAHGERRLDARAGDPVAGDQRHRRGRGAATHEHRATPTSTRRPISR